MSGQENQELVDRLQDEDPKERIRAIRRLTAVVDLEAVPDIANVYRDEDQPDAVRKVARESLGVFQAIKEALERNEEVTLPAPEDVREPRFTPESLRRLLIILSVLLGLLVIANVVLAIVPGATEQSGQVVTMADPADLAVQLRARLEQVQADVDIQRQAWRQYQAIQTLGCDRFSPPAGTSRSSSDLNALLIDGAAFPDLQQANASLITAINQFTPISGNWLIGCSTKQVPVTADQSLAQLDQVTAALEAAAAALDRADVALSLLQTEEPAPVEEPTEAADTPADTTMPLQSTAAPTEVPLPTRPVVDYARYIAGMRERIDFALGGRGVATLLSQYWQDVRSSGQTGGCRQPLTADNIQDYRSVTPEVAALDPRLNDIQTALNVGLTLTRESLANFQQGCVAGNFAAVLNAGQQQIQQAISALNQTSAMLDQIQAEISSRP